MSITTNLMLACAIALSGLSDAPRSSLAIDAAPVAASAAPVQSRAAAPVAQSVSLTPTEMAAVHGNGFWKKLFRAVVKVVRWIVNVIRDLPPIVLCLTAPCPGTPNDETVFDPGLDGDVTDTFENEITVNEFYDDEIAFNEGRVSSSSQSESGFVFIGRSGGGGGGDGDTCEPSNGCYAY
jgi:hypothetical protein